MRRIWPGLLALILVGGALSFLLLPKARAKPPHPVEARLVAVPTLQLGELFEPGAKLKPTLRVRALDGQRVRMVGFMAEMEQPPVGALYLTPRPVKCDEAGGGTGDLPPNSVLVVVPSASGRTLPHIAGAVEAIGVLEVGNRTDEAGRSANFRLRLDEAPRALDRNGS